MRKLKLKRDSISNENCSEVKRSLQLNSILNSKTMISDKANSSKGKGKSSRSKQSKNPKDRKPTSYITDYYAVNEKLYAHIKGLVKDFNLATQHFFFHVFASYMLPKNLKEDTWIPIPRETIDKKFGKERVDIQGLIDAGLIERTDSYSIKNNICYCYRIHLDILEKIENYYPTSFEEIQSLNYYNLITGKKIIKSRKSTLTYGINKDKLPELPYQGIKGIKRTFVNINAGWKYIKDCHVGIKTQKHYRKYLNDLRCLESITKDIKYTEEGLAYYSPAYEAQRSGRISELEGRLQSCSRALKDALFQIPNLHNYDLKSSQVYILKFWFEKAGISTKWFDYYLASNKNTFAVSIGISVKCFKNCTYAKFMGAEYIIINRYWDKEAGKYKPKFFCKSIVEYLLEEAEKINKGRFIIDNDKANEDLMWEILEKFNNFILPLQQKLDKFYKWLIYNYCEKNQVKGVVKNLAGMPFDLKRYKNTNGKYKKISELKRKLTAFFLQGTEAAFIHYLTREDIQQKYNYEVINNQHDGLVTIGEIPEAAKEEAKEVLSLPYASLVEKNICDEEEKTWWLI